MPTQATSTTQSTKPKSNHFLSISIKKLPTKTQFTIRATKEFEDFFASLANNDTMLSNNWKTKDGESAKFYKITDEMKEKLDSISQSSVFSDVGNYLVEGDHSGRVNIAFLRVVGLSKGVTITCDNTRIAMVDNYEIEHFAKRFAQYAKVLFERFVERKTIKALITTEV